MAKKFVSPWEQIVELKKLLQLMVQKVLYMEKLEDIKNHTMTTVVMDAASIACADVFQMGPGRAKKWRDAVEATLEQLDRLSEEELNRRIDFKGRVVIEGDEYITATRDQIDRRLRWIYGDAAFADFETRYRWKENREFFDNYEKLNRTIEENAGKINEAVGQCVLRVP